MTDNLKQRIAEAMYKALHNRVPAANCDEAAQAVFNIIEPMIPKYGDIKDAPQDGTEIIGFWSYLYPGDKSLTRGFEVIWWNNGWESHEGIAADGLYTNFMIPQPPAKE